VAAGKESLIRKSKVRKVKKIGKKIQGLLGLSKEKKSDEHALLRKDSVEKAESLGDIMDEVQIKIEIAVENKSDFVHSALEAYRELKTSKAFQQFKKVNMVFQATKKVAGGSAEIIASVGLDPHGYITVAQGIDKAIDAAKFDPSAEAAKAGGYDNIPEGSDYLGADGRRGHGSLSESNSQPNRIGWYDMSPIGPDLQSAASGE